MEESQFGSITWLVAMWSNITGIMGRPGVSSSTVSLLIILATELFAMGFLIGNQVSCSLVGKSAFEKQDWRLEERSNLQGEQKHKTKNKQPKGTFIVASSEAETMTLKTGWKMTRVTGLLCPLRAYLSGGRGIHSFGSRFWPMGPPRVISSFASFSFDSNSITC